MECTTTITSLPNDARFQYSILDTPMVGREPDVRVYVRVKEEEAEEKAPDAHEVARDETTDEIQIKEEVDVEEDEERLIIVTEVGAGRGDQNGEPTVYWDASLNLNGDNSLSEDVEATTPSSDSPYEQHVRVEFVGNNCTIQLILASLLTRLP